MEMTFSSFLLVSRFTSLDKTDGTQMFSLQSRKPVTPVMLRERLLGLTGLNQFRLRITSLRGAPSSPNSLSLPPASPSVVQATL